MTARGFGKLFATALAGALIAPAATLGWAASAPIYKCLDRNLGISYTDIPCKDGERLELRTGDADPAAIARLDREREALDRSIGQRIADERRANLQRRTYDQPASWFRRASRIPKRRTTIRTPTAAATTPTPTAAPPGPTGAVRVTDASTDAPTAAAASARARSRRTRRPRIAEGPPRRGLRWRPRASREAPPARTRP